jgi:hypothetical protein
MRRLLAAAAAAGLLLAAPAHAQSGSAATPLVGSGSFSTAPELASGTTYADSIRPGEVLYYAVPLTAGQAMEARLELQEQVEDAIVAFAPYDPLRRTAGSPVTAVSGAGTLTTEPAAADSTASAGDEASGPGTWYVAINATTNAQTGAQYDLPFTLVVDVTGDASQAPAATPTPTPTATPEPTPTAAPEASDDDEPALGLVAGVGAAGLVIGGLGGAGLRRRAPR